MKRIQWDIEEMVAMVDLYYRYENGKISNLSKELNHLSKRLVNRADILKIEHDNKYRNTNGMNMIFQNVRYVDTDGETGFSSASQLVYDVVKLYKDDYKKFEQILNDFNSKY
ncbi:MAG: hypothetical protein SOT68_00685 [Oscillospiraceae bacterium]|nr:hypothetical protein [Oscillospiraceae bacterium]